MPDIPDSAYMSPEICAARMKELGCCVIIPTYNNVHTVEAVIRSVTAYAPDVFVVLDGPTDGTADVVKKIEGIRLVEYAINRGKGYALRKGFEAARKAGFLRAVTLDSDGQHFAHDIATLIRHAEQNPDALIVGARKMEGADQNKKSSFANRFSNMWFKIETFHSLPDTQSGFRYYPIHKMEGMRFLSTKYEFEVEVLVKAVWRGIAVTSVPVDVYYPPQQDRVSHFRPGPDFTRISFLNAYLVFGAMLYGHWAVILHYLTWANLKSFFRRHFLDADEPLLRKAASVSLGVFMGIFPVWGFQMILCGILAHVLRLNKAISLLSSNVSAPPMAAPVVYFSYLFGLWILPPDKEMPLRWDLIREDPSRFIVNSSMQYLAGSVALALLAALVAFLVSYPVFALFMKGMKSEAK
jgi:glycosyltransferase involved in cell wall biosynthesis